MRAIVYGSGGWGTALALLLADNGHKVTLWSAFEEESEELKKNRENKFLKGVPLPGELEFTADPEAGRGADLAVLAPPSFALRQTARRLKGIFDEKTILVSVSKGIEEGTALRLTQVIRQELGDNIPLAALSGPSHAEEVGLKVPTACVMASPDAETAERARDFFMNERFRVYSSPDIIGVELGGALKNVIALGSGICDGLGYGDNTKAMLMTRGLTEIARLGVALGGRQETFLGLAGVGDLIVTCTSLHSRNRRAGILIGQGRKPEEAVREVGVVEGYYAARSAKELSEKVGVEMPIASAAYDVLFCGGDVNSVLSRLMTRAKRSEIENVLP